MRKQLKQELRDTMYVHVPLALHKEKSLEQEYALKKVLKRKIIWNGSNTSYKPAANTLAVLESDENINVLRLTAPLRTDCWPEGGEPNGNYSNFGTAQIAFAIPKEDWRDYNRLYFQIKPAVKGGRLLYMNAGIVNEGETAVPDPYMREGDSLFSPDNGIWNDCYWEFNAMPRDCITKVSFSVSLTGKEGFMEDHLIYEFRNIYLEKIEAPEKEKGWACPENKIIFSTAGYFADGEKTAFIANTGIKEFSLRRQEDGKTVHNGEVRILANEKGDFGILDFSDFAEEGEYRIKAGNMESEAFPIGRFILEEPVWKALNFIFCERCGTPVPGKHQACHLDMMAYHNGLSLSFAGGWHDAGDVSQQAVQTGEVVHALFEAAASLSDKSILKKRLLEEAQWGLDHVLRTRFGDGFRATSAGATRISNGFLGDMDDIIVRVHNHSFDNFMFAGIEAYAAYALKDTDKELAFGCLKTAAEDYAFAEEEFERNGLHMTEMFEHTYSSGMSQYYAVMSWAASCIYLAGKEEKYAHLAAEWADKLLACQEKGESGCRITGFFYRDEKHEEIVHFNHQSREHQFMQALSLLCKTQREHADYMKWQRAMELYGSYLKVLMSHSEPYHMIPSGIYRMDEAEKKDTFKHLHLMTDYEVGKCNYNEQLKQGIEVDADHVIKHFPVWFSFRGNNAVLLSQAKSASLLGRHLKDEELLQIGRDQMYWLWGRNPFAQSLQYGVGSRYCRQYTAFCTDTAGAIPVGIETCNNEDVPYWPQNVNATYKEVWMSCVGRFLLLAADYMKEEDSGW